MSGGLTRRAGAQIEQPAAGDTPRVRRLAASASARVHIDVTIPRTDIAGKMRLLSRVELLAVKREAIAAMAKFPEASWSLTGVAREDWNAELAVRTLAVAVRDPSDVTQPLDDVDQWREQLDDEQIGALADTYEDLRIQLDPLAEPIALTEAEIDALDQAVKKKDVDLLRSCGLRKLWTYTLTLADRLSTSPTPKS